MGRRGREKEEGRDCERVKETGRESKWKIVGESRRELSALVRKRWGIRKWKEGRGRGRKQWEGEAVGGRGSKEENRRDSHNREE